MSRGRGSSRDRGEQAGFSLLEVLIALVIVGTLVIALINGLLTTTKADNATNENQRMNAALTSFTETLKDIKYQACGDPGWYNGVYQDTLARIADEDERRRVYGVAAMSDVSVVKVQYFSAASFPVDAATGNQNRVGGEFSDVCDSAADTGTQKISVRVRYQGRSRTAQVVKRSDKGVSVEAFIAPDTPETPGNTRPTSNFTFVNSTPTTFVFTSTATDEGADAGLVAWSWSFGDGTPVASGENVTHTFGPGQYQVTLTVTDRSGAKATRTRTVGPISGTPAAPTNFRLVRSRGATGAASSTYDFSWNKVPGVLEYRITARWCVDWGIFGGEVCYSSESWDFGDVGAGTIYRGSPPAVGIGGFIYLKVYVQARVGSTWGPASNAVELT